MASPTKAVQGVSSQGERYSRQVLFPGIGAEGQQRLGSAQVAVVGCGATGAAAASLLARAGVGSLTIVDRDFVEESNLQRQVLFDEADARESLPKAEAALRKIKLFNSEINVAAHVADLTPGNIHQLLAGADIILDATDNFQTRYLVNDYAVEQRRPWIYSAAIGAYAVTMNILPEETACLACIFPEPPGGTVETCDTSGILNTAVNFAASIAVTEALKFLIGSGSKMRRTLLSCDLWSNEYSEVAAATPRPDCEVCEGRDFRHLRGEGRPHITLCGRNSVQIHERNRPIDLAALEARLKPHGEVRFNQLLLRFTRGEHTITVFSDGRAIIQGTTDTAVARSLYARFVGS
ncbi:MAG TPA: ThiF family adenylyltransferase [Acidobacteriaceae bacterium]|nr:ThiF family adenylyltransferase [Acidobacteriaceae bacterium]